MISQIKLSVAEYKNFKKIIGKTVQFARDYEKLKGLNFEESLNDQLDMRFGDNEFKRDAGRGLISFISENEN